jgi:hypothetical protein
MGAIAGAQAAQRGDEEAGQEAKGADSTYIACATVTASGQCRSQARSVVYMQHLFPCAVQDEVDRLDKQLAERHAREAAALEARVSSTAAAAGHDGAPDAGAMQLAGSLYDVKLSNDRVWPPLSSFYICSLGALWRSSHVSMQPRADAGQPP